MFRRNSTIEMNEKTCNICGLPKFIFSKGRCVDCARIEETQKRMEKASEIIIKEDGLSSLIEDADTIFSRYVRLKYSNERGLAKCYTCGIEKHWTMLQNGHFIKRAHLYLRWDERNCRPQCSTCNETKYGEIAVFREKLDKESCGLPEILFDEMKLVHKPTREEVRAVISEYTQKVKIMKAKIASH